MLGSGAANLRFPGVLSTCDFDVVDTETDFLADDLVRLISEYGEAHGLGDDWINDAIAVYGTVDEHKSRLYAAEQVIEFKGRDNGALIELELPSAEYVLYKKLMVGRDKDIRSAVDLGRAMGLESIDDFRDFVLSFNPELVPYYESGRYDWDEVADRLVQAIEESEEGVHQAP